MLCIYSSTQRCNKPNCPYRHVKLSEDAAPCIAFQNGACPLGLECQSLHVYINSENESESAGHANELPVSLEGSDRREEHDGDNDNKSQPDNYFFDYGLPQNADRDHPIFIPLPSLEEMNNYNGNNNNRHNCNYSFQENGEE